RETLVAFTSAKTLSPGFSFISWTERVVMIDAISPIPGVDNYFTEDFVGHDAFHRSLELVSDALFHNHCKLAEPALLFRKNTAASLSAGRHDSLAWEKDASLRLHLWRRLSSRYRPNP